MDMFLRIVAIFVEVALLAVIFYAMLNGVRLAAFDLGVGPKYNRAVTMALVAAGIIVVIFFIAHLTTFYPTISG